MPSATLIVVLGHKTKVFQSIKQEHPKYTGKKIIKFIKQMDIEKFRVKIDALSFGAVEDRILNAQTEILDTIQNQEIYTVPDFSNGHIYGTLIYILDLDKEIFTIIGHSLFLEHSFSEVTEALLDEHINAAWKKEVANSFRRFRNMFRVCF